MIELRRSNPLGGRIGSFRLLPNYCDVFLGAGGCYSVFVIRHTRPKVHYWNMMRKVWTHLFKVFRHGGCQMRSVEMPRGELGISDTWRSNLTMMGFRTPDIEQQQQQQQPHFFVLFLIFFIILGINLYLFLKFEVYYFTLIYHLNGSVNFNESNHILSANINYTRIPSILIFLSCICH